MNKVILFLLLYQPLLFSQNYQTWVHKIDRPMDKLPSWDVVHDQINIFNLASPRRTLWNLHHLTFLNLGSPQVSLGLNKNEHQEYLKDINLKWVKWWKIQGLKISKARINNAAVDQQAYEEALKILNYKAPFQITKRPVWVPNEWEFVFEFTNGDYGGRVHELWILNKGPKASLIKVFGRYHDWPVGWLTSVYLYKNIKPEYLDHFLKTLSYLLEYNLKPKPNIIPSQKNENKELSPFYYPYGRMTLSDQHGKIWNTHGFDFYNKISQFNFHDNEGFRIDRLNDFTGIAYLLLNSMFDDKKRWTETTTLSQNQLNSLSNVLRSSKPTFLSQSSDILKVLSRMGGDKERETILDWLKRSEQSSKKLIPWQLRSTEFGTNSEENIRNFSSLEMEAAKEALQFYDKRINNKTIR